MAVPELAGTYTPKQMDLLVSLHVGIRRVLAVESHYLQHEGNVPNTRKFEDKNSDGSTCEILVSGAAINDLKHEVFDTYYALRSEGQQQIAQEALFTHGIIFQDEHAKPLDVDISEFTQPRILSNTTDEKTPRQRIEEELMHHQAEEGIWFSPTEERKLAGLAMVIEAGFRGSLEDLTNETEVFNAETYTPSNYDELEFEPSNAPFSEIITDVEEDNSYSPNNLTTDQKNKLGLVKWSAEHNKGFDEGTSRTKIETVAKKSKKAEKRSRRQWRKYRR